MPVGAVLHLHASSAAVQLPACTLPVLVRMVFESTLRSLVIATDGQPSAVKFTMSTSLSALCTIFTLQILLYAYTLLMFERATLEGPLKSWASAIWLIITTMTTVGYGDIYPTTRMVSCECCDPLGSCIIVMSLTWLHF